MKTLPIVPCERCQKPLQRWNGTGKLLPCPCVAKQNYSVSANEGITQVDIAKKVGVSRATVSLVLSGNDKGRVSASTAAKIRETAIDLGYLEAA